MMLRPGVPFNRDLTLMGLFGFVAGLPLSLSGFTLRQWFSESGVSLTAIGLTAMIGLAYTLKFLWSPVLDQVVPPAAWLGRRRGWLLTIQPLMALAGAALAVGDPAAFPLGVVLAAVALAFLSASQDIVVDAWRIETFPQAAQGVALATYVWGYRLALLVAGAGAIRFASEVGWRGSLLTMAGLMAAGTLVTLAAREPPAPPPDPGLRFADRLRGAVVEPFRDFVRRPLAGRVLAFVMLFKLGEAMAHTMATPFYQAMGFDRNQVAYATGVPGLFASLLGAATGGWLVSRVGAGRALVGTGFVQMASMGMYFALAVSGGETHILLAKIVIENFAEAMADAAFLTFLSGLCSARYTATQYALLSSLAAVGLRTIGGFSGVLAEALGWVPFYGLTIFAAVPAMLIMVGLIRRQRAAVA